MAQQLSVEQVAAVVHDARRTLCILTGYDSPPPWDETEAWQRENAVRGVRRVMTQPDVTDEERHAEWLAAQERDGWVWGSVRDGKAKTHPCIVPFAQLPREQRMIDDLCRGVILSLAPYARGER